MMRLIKNHLFLIVLLLVKNVTLFGSEVSLYKLTENDILNAKSQLEQAARFDKILRYSLLTGAVGLAGFALFKVTPWVHNHLRQDRAHALVDRAGLIDVEIKQQVTKINLEKIAECVLAQAKEESSWGQWAKGLVASTGTALLPAMGSAILQPKINAILQEQNINKLVFNLGIMNHFQRLKLAQIQFDPNMFASNINHQNDSKLCIYAKHVAANFAQMPPNKVAELRAEAQVVWVEEANQIIKQMAQVIAYTKYMANNNGTCSILNNFAEQLYLATDEFANKLEKAFAIGDTAALYEAVALLQSTFNMTLNNVLIFSR